jgi:hypothetical protein
MPEITPTSTRCCRKTWRRLHGAAPDPLRAEEKDQKKKGERMRTKGASGCRATSRHRSSGREFHAIDIERGEA